MASNKALVPEAKKALEQFKMEAASEVGVTLNQGYNGDLTSKQAGSIGGQMVKKMIPARTSIFTRKSRILPEHKSSYSYIYSISLFGRETPAEDTES